MENEKQCRVKLYSERYKVKGKGIYNWLGTKRETLFSTYGNYKLTKRKGKGFKMEKILEYLKENVDIIRDLVQDCNSWNGSLDYYVYYENNEEFFNLFFENNPNEAVRAVYYGDYRYMDDYVQFNGYGNLTSASEWQVEDELKEGVEDIFETWYDLYKDNNVDTYDDELKEMIEDLENGKGEE